MTIKYTCIIAVIIFLFSFCSCGSIKPGAILGKSKPYEQFAMPDNKTMYFFKYMFFADKQNKMVVDATFYDNNIDNDTATLNFTLYSNHLIKSIDSVIIGNNNRHFPITNTKFIYADVHRKYYYSRFSMKLELKKYLQLFDDHNWSAQIYCPDKYLMSSTPKTKKIIDKLNRHVVFIIKAK